MDWTLTTNSALVDANNFYAPSCWVRFSEIGKSLDPPSHPNSLKLHQSLALSCANKVQNLNFENLHLAPPGAWSKSKIRPTLNIIISAEYCRKRLRFSVSDSSEQSRDGFLIKKMGSAPLTLNVWSKFACKFAYTYERACTVCPKTLLLLLEPWFW